ncbi:hypothetical protein RvVAT039_pl05750 (plasmid) [Agrobacterium vitis]|nr:hypothetical protein RvVAT039_pl05750 [Agrobacterium vitis]
MDRSVPTDTERAILADGAFAAFVFDINWVLRTVSETVSLAAPAANLSIWQPELSPISRIGRITAWVL